LQDKTAGLCADQASPTTDAWENLTAGADRRYQRGGSIPGRQFYTGGIEMKIRKAFLLASMALAVLAFSVPAGASALTVKDAGKELENKEIPFEGLVKFETLGTGMECPITVKVLVNKQTVSLKTFSVTSPTTECRFFGSLYGNCAFEQHPSGLLNGPLDLDLSTDAGGEHTATVTSGTDSQTHGVINSELTTKVGSTGACNITTQDITIVHEPLVTPAVGITADIETNATGFVTALKLTGSIRIDRGVASAGTVVSSDSSTGISGTFHIEETSNENTYKIE
jgi:hypothetical protein